MHHARCSSSATNPRQNMHRIVVGADGSEDADGAVERAAIQADRTRSVLEIHAAFGPGSVFLAPSEVEAATRHRAENAAELAHRVAPQVSIDCATHEGSPTPALIEASADADLLVVGSRGLCGFRALLLGSVSQHCTMHARCPVVVVR